VPNELTANILFAVLKGIYSLGKLYGGGFVAILGKVLPVTT